MFHNIFQNAPPNTLKQHVHWLKISNSYHRHATQKVKMYCENQGNKGKSSIFITAKVSVTNLTFYSTRRN